MKLLSFGFFGLGSILFSLAVFPAMRIFLHPKERFQKYARPLVSGTMRLFVFIMFCLGVVKLDAGQRDAYRNLAGKIVVANHPSLLDIVMLLSLIPNGDCIVNAKLSRNVVRWIIRQLYIPNSLNFDELIRSCTQSLHEGNCIIIFPEGTRTPRSGDVHIKKGAARLALFSGCAVVPIHIGGTDKYGLGKHDPWLAFNHTEKYLYRLRILDEIDPRDFSGQSAPIAAKLLTEEIKRSLFGQP